MGARHSSVVENDVGVRSNALAKMILHEIETGISEKGVFDINSSNMPLRSGRISSRIEKLLRDYGEETSTRDVFMVAVKFRKHIVIWGVYIQTFFGEIMEASFYSYPVKDSNRKTIFGEVSFSIDSDTRNAHIHTIEKLPEHNIPSGEFAVNIVTSLARALGASTADLIDASSIICPSARFKRQELPRRFFQWNRRQSVIRPQYPKISLRIVSLLTKGMSWYENFGFKNTSFALLSPAKKREITMLFKRVRDLPVKDILERYESLIEMPNDLSVVNFGVSMNGILPQEAIKILDRRIRILIDIMDFIGNDSTVSDAFEILTRASLGGDQIACELESNFSSFFIITILPNDEKEKYDIDLLLEKINIIVSQYNMKIDLSKISGD